MILTFFVSFSISSQDNKSNGSNFNKLSEEFLIKIKNGENTEAIREQLASTTIEELEDGLQTDTQKLAFWLNIYNGYIQFILQENPDSYSDRGSFFKKEQIKIAGTTIAFEKIEHGIIRKSQWPLGLGMIRKWFPNKLERKLRVEERDYRVHFALNCGAKDCPPVAIYYAEKLDEQLDLGTKKYLTQTTVYNKEENTVSVTPLFSWFRGDFGCKKGVKEILKAHNIVDDTKGLDITYKGYDWTLDLDNWIKL
ncbi:DUF547 domain-containing protein [Cellulophaga sp. HaHaR_3_176]|uniref:DUF547 domain-containing protein n=1 Tax=Cellulophaga sp. HaHaR_3_176 TaxID=1942464 RepID=UPI0020B1243E|nr:DUF547 domain-containing protein [Cellulophaga sp. HaHaR_3_176]